MTPVAVKFTHDIEECPEITAYLALIEKPEKDYPVCKEQKMLAKYIRRIFAEETLYINLTQLEKYLSFQKYFSYDLFPWEKFLFTLHNCTYREDGRPRWKEMFALVGRGAGKNGMLSFENFCLLTPANARYEVIDEVLYQVGGIEKYHIDLFANSEDQAKMTFNDIYGILNDAPPAVQRKLAKNFYWNKEVIRNLQTGSELTFRTSSTKSQDSRRPGKVDFDEYHQYSSYSVVGTAESGLGKKPYPKKTIISTNGDVRDGPLDHLLAQSLDILKGTIPDNGILPFICRLDDKKEVKDQKNWHKANPSLRYFPDLLDEMQGEYAKYVQDNIGNAAFMTKRMNLPLGNLETEVTSWENIKAASRAPKQMPTAWVAGIDFAMTTDFVAVVLFGIAGDEWVWKTHTWVCSQCKDLSRIKYPIQDAVERGLITWVEDVEIPAEMPAMWIVNQMESKQILGVAIDDFRYGLMSKALTAAGFVAGKEGNVKLVKGRDIMQIAPQLVAKFARHEIAFGDNSLMRWYINNTKQQLDTHGNMLFSKIEPKSRKTDGFMAAVAATTLLERLELDEAMKSMPTDIFVF